MADEAGDEETKEFGGDLAGAVIWGADMRGATIRDVDLTGTRISHAFVVDVEIDALVDRLVVNGVDVTDVVNAGDPWYATRRWLNAGTADEFRLAWAAIEAEWARTVAIARTLTDEQLHESVDGEFSFVQTVRHLVFAIDKWFTLPIEGRPLHAIGLPNTGSLDVPFPGLDLSSTPSTDEALEVHADRLARVRAHVAAATDADLDREVDVPENGPHAVRQCYGTLVEESFWHIRYARRDLAALGATG